jgi:hypothetical protein
MAQLVEGIASSCYSYIVMAFKLRSVELCLSNFLCFTLGETVVIRT